ncbi:MAG: 50S ribosomal protein L17, partial [Verrucomicrobia bacterium]|nr:50S ribosomal protein L17 [Verrucomicrobiota bacterium]
MRHRKKTIKLGRTSSHRDVLLAGLVCNLIAANRIQTTVTKAKAAKSMADKMVTLGKKGDLAARRLAISALHNKDAVAKLFSEVAPRFEGRAGGYTRVLKLGKRISDSSEMAILEWVEGAKPKKKATKKTTSSSAKAEE